MRAWLAILPVLMILASSGSAHGPGEEPSGGYIIELSPLSAAAGVDTAFYADIAFEDGDPAAGLAVRLVFDRHAAGISDTVNAKEREPGRYFAVYRFSQPGEDWEVHVQFEAGETPVRKTFSPIKVAGAGAGPWILGAGAALFIAGIALYALSPVKKGRRRFGAAGIALSLVGIIVVVAYSGLAYFQAGAERGIVVCDNQGRCLWQAHIHSFVAASVCGEQRDLGVEVGDLTRVHTHEERNVLHWHDRLPSDPAGNLLETGPLRLGNSLQEVGMNLTDSCLYGLCNGMACPGESQPGTLKAFVRNEKEASWRELEKPSGYVWKDRDIIYLAFDSRSAGEALAALEASQLSFPLLGTG